MSADHRAGAAQNARIREYVRQVVSGFPPLTEAEKEWLAPIWRRGVLAVRERRAEEQRREKAAARRAVE